MTAKTDPISGLSYGWAYGEDAWNTGMDANLVKLGATVNISVLDFVTTPSVTTNGTRYIVSATASGDFTGQEGKLAARVEAAWVFYTLPEGCIVYRVSNTKHYKYESSAYTMLSGTESFLIAASDLTTAITTGASKAYFPVPYAFTVTEVIATLITAQASGSIFTVDINEGGTSILSTKLTIDNTETSSLTAATQPVISDASLAKGGVITIDVDQVGASGALGLIVTIVGYKT